MFEDGGIFLSIATIVSVLGGFWKVYTWVSTKDDRRNKELDEVRKDLADYKLAASEKFATRPELSAAITRVENAVDKVINRIDGFSIEVNRALRSAHRSASEQRHSE
jgi:hypothetical protein